jgi:hypothetical protein
MKKYKNYIIGLGAGVLWGMYMRGYFDDKRELRNKSPKIADY